jgi:hypothetical protein
MRRAVALAAAAGLLAAAGPLAAPLPSASTAEAKPLRFAAASKRAPCAAAKKKKSKTCRVRPTRRGWTARGPLAPSPPLPTVTGPHDAAPPAEAAEAPVVPAGAPAEEGVAPPPPPPPAPACDPSPWVGVTAEDVNGFRLRLSRLCVPEGTVLFQFRNNDIAFHNVYAEGTDPVRASRQVVGDTPGETVVTASEQLAAGEWRLYCSLPGHEAMSRPLDVTPAG